MNYYVKVIEFETGELVECMDLDGDYKRALLVEAGLNINLDSDKYYTSIEDTPE